LPSEEPLLMNINGGFFVFNDVYERKWVMKNRSCRIH